MKIYIASILVYFIGVVICAIRILSLKLIDKNKKRNKIETIYGFIRMVTLGLIPVINTLFAIVFLYLGLIIDDEKFTKIYS